MSNLRIELSNGKFDYFPATKNPEVGQKFTASDMEEDVQRYWVGNEERKFLLPFWKISRLIDRSNLDQLALKIQDIESIDEVDALWVSFNAATRNTNNSKTNLELLSNAVERIAAINSNLYESISENYFVFGTDVLTELNGALSSLNAEKTDQVLVGRIGKSSDNNYVIYFMLGEVKIHGASQISAREVTATSRAISNACGVRLPPK